MSIFQNPRALAKADFENSISHVESYDSDTKAYFQAVADTESNINFAERISLITEAEANYYRSKLKKARDTIDKRQRDELIAEREKKEQKKTFMAQKKEQIIVHNDSLSKAPIRQNLSDYERTR